MSTTWPTRGATDSNPSSTARGDTAATRRETAAIERAIEEIGLISDPHRAIDWLSTFPQVVLVAIGEDL